MDFTDINRSQLMNIVESWRLGDIDESAVQRKAEAILEALPATADFGESDDRSIAREVLFQLDALPAVLIVKADIDAIMRFLQTPAGAAAEGWREWRSYWDRIDEGERREQLRNHPFYFT
jgi:hypothetical protein